MARRVALKRNRRRQIWGDGRCKEPGMLQKKSAITPGPPYLVQGLLEISAHLARVKRSLDASNPQQSRCPHVRLCLLCCQRMS
jgi:hypothetical protein